MAWLSDPGLAKQIGLVIFFVAFCYILFWAYGNRQRGEKLEEYKNLPFLDDDEVKKD